jgi:hypothetical protein
MAWPLVGRERELERIADARSEPGCSGIVLSTAAGVGKSSVRTVETHVYRALQKLGLNDRREVRDRAGR